MTPYGQNRYDYFHHPGWVAVSADTDLLTRLRAQQQGTETIHQTARRILLLGLDTCQ